MRVAHYRAELSKSVVALQNVAGGDDLGDVLSDEFDANTRTSSAPGLDVGLIWVSPAVQLGATLANLNTPEFEYPGLGENCTAFTGARRSNCESAAFFGDRVELDETYEMESRLTIEGSIFPLGTRRWMLSGSVDVNETDDPVGDPRQRMSLSAAYLTDSWKIPGLRAGYHRNLAGSRLGYVSLGATLLRVVHLDVAWTLEQVDMDGDRFARGAAVTAGVELSF